VVVHLSNIHTSYHGSLADASPEELLWSKETRITCAVYVCECVCVCVRLCTVSKYLILLTSRSSDSQMILEMFFRYFPTVQSHTEYLFMCTVAGSNFDVCLNVLFSATICILVQRLVLFRVSGLCFFIIFIL